MLKEDLPIGTVVEFRRKKWVVVPAQRFGWCDGCAAKKSRRCADRHNPPCGISTILANHDQKET